jgi:hypothetical protein
MSLSIRSVLPLLVAAIALALFTSTAQAQTDKIAAKIEKAVDKTITKFDKTVESYDKKVDGLVARTSAKVAKMVAKNKPAEEINETINKAIMTGMNFAATTRAKIDTTEVNGLRAVDKYSTHPDADDAETEIAAAADTCFEDIDEIWTVAGEALHALEVDVP